MSELLFNLNLLMPVFHGGDLFEGAIQSIENSNIEFDKVYISFNGKSADDFELFSSLLSRNLLKKKYHIFRTHKDLDSREHGIFFLEQLEKCCLSHSMILLLAHDDRIAIPDSRQFISFITQSSPMSTVFFPSYRLYRAGIYVNPRIIISDNRKMTSQDFFLKSLSQNISTNMSGMVMPYLSLREAVLSQSLAKAGGARFEHLTCIAKNTKQVIFHDKIHALIGERDNSDGMTLTLMQHRKASLNYIVQFFKNKKINSFQTAAVWGYHFIKKIIGLVMAFIYSSLPRSQ